MQEYRDGPALKIFVSLLLVWKKSQIFQFFTFGSKKISAGLVKKYLGQSKVGP